MSSQHDDPTQPDPQPDDIDQTIDLGSPADATIPVTPPGGEATQADTGGGDAPTMPDEDMPTIVSPGAAGAEAPTIASPGAGGQGGQVPPPPPGSAGGADFPEEPNSHVFADRFEVVSLLGEGGMGRVYRVRDRQIEGREVALKVLRPRYSRNQRFRDLFFQEIRAAQKFVAEQVNQVRDTGQMDDGRLFLTMDLVDGESLSDLVGRENILNTRHALEITRQVLIGLGSGHEQGFIHRDIKPSNVMLASRVAKTDENPYGVGVRLLDFGIAALAHEVGEGAVSGTPMYMSPEQAQGQRLDARSDLFSVGIVLYELLSGSRPFEGTTLEEVSTSLVETKVAPMIKGLDHLKPAVQKILKKALEKDRDRRFQSAGDFIKAIEGSKAYQVPTGVPAWVGGLLFLSLVGNAGVGGFAFYQKTQLDEADRLREEQGGSQDEQYRLLKGQYDAKVTELEEVRQNAGERERTLLNEKATEVDQLTERHGAAIDAKNAKILELNNAITKLQEQSGNNDVLSQVDSDKIEELRGEIGALKDQVDELTQINEQLTLEAAPQAKVAQSFDSILDFTQRGFGADALREYGRMIDNSVFAAGNYGGSDFLETLATAAEGLELYRKNPASNAGRAVEAVNAIETLRARRDAFEIECQSWLTHRLPTEPVPTRMADLDATLDHLSQLGAQAVADVNERQTESFRGIEEGPATQSPDDVIAYGSTRGWERLETFFGKLADLLGETDSDGGIDLVALERIEVLDRWGEFLSTVPDGVPTDVVENVVWYWWAKRWYRGEDIDVLPFADEYSWNEAEPTRDWRGALLLQVAMEPALAARVKARRGYREVNLSGGEVTWYAETFLREVSDDGRSQLQVNRRTFIDGGDQWYTSDSPVNYEIDGPRVRGHDRSVLVDVRDAANSRVARWSPPAAPNAPRSTELADQATIDGFVGGFPSDGLPVLVYSPSGSSVEYWFSPDHGLVREVRAGGYDRQLAHSK